MHTYYDREHRPYDNMMPMNGTERAVHPDLSRGGLSFKKALTEEEGGQQGALF
jgi:hypothetical protein